MNDLEFQSGMAKLAVVFGVEPDVPMISIWNEAVSYLSDTEWQDAIRRTIQTTVTTYGRFPPPAVVLQHVQQAMESELQQEADAAYRRVIDRCSSYSPETGDHWSYGAVLNLCGRAAAQAFGAMGGDESLQRSFDSAKRWEKFRTEYIRVAGTDPEARLLPGTTPKVLPAAPAVAEITRGEADRVMAKLLSMTPSAQTAPRRKALAEPLSDEKWNERMAELRRQAEQIKRES